MFTELPTQGPLRLDGGTQLREEISGDAVRDFAEDLARGDVFPPVVAFWDGKDYWLADGFHRLYAHLKLLRETIKVDVRRGTLRDAVLYAAGCNYAGQMRRTPADKRKAVLRLLADPEWFARSDNWVAAACHVSDKTVATLRRQVVDGELELPALPGSEIRTCSQSDSTPPPTTRTGKDGKIYPARRVRDDDDLPPEVEVDDEEVDETPAPPPPPKDGAGRVIPERLREVFASRWLFDRALQLTGQVREAVQAASASPGGHYLAGRWADAARALALVTQALEEGRPHATVCPACRNKDAGCGVCGGGWWGPKGKATR